MGLGMALMEEMQFDERNSHVMNLNLADAHEIEMIVDRHPRPTLADKRTWGR